ncbi:hypothetical protein LV84_00334 [Algoriphagus ratkowskyi]|uniref:Uncharacterized protein n=1 Tax=Algoriphagus ratkowskyi TaxID=57028 RepID=A0A2W7RQZ7_9BACT|nr:hypothetical protein LV84_00334 [Algoriphagus ratkowskyi]
MQRLYEIQKELGLTLSLNESVKLSGITSDYCVDPTQSKGA